MPVSGHERMRRKEVEQAVEHLPQIDADNTDAIREQAIAEFTRQLDAKLKNLQPGERLSVMFTIDIVRANGRIRGGSGASRNMPEYIEWRSAVYARDNYTCQECGSHKKLNAHHIKAWSKHPALRFDVDNGITLCKACHAKRHPHIGFSKHS